MDERQRARLRGAQSRARSTPAVGTVAGANPVTPVAELVAAMAAELGLGDSPADRRTVRQLRRLSDWATGEGLSLDREVILDPDTVERFVEVGLAGDRSRATYRAVLRRAGPLLTKRAPWEPRSAAVARRQVAPPYTPDEVQILRADALEQPTAPRRRAARALLALGLGTGLDGRWVTRVAAGDIARSASAVLVRVGEPSARSVVALAEWEHDLVDLAATAGDEFLVGGLSTSTRRTGHLTDGLVVPHRSSSPGGRPVALDLARDSFAGRDSPARVVPSSGLTGCHRALGSSGSGRAPGRVSRHCHAAGYASMSRGPIDTDDGRPTSAGELNIARQLVQKSGVVAVLSPFLDADVGRPRLLSLEGLLVALQLNALHRHHQAHLVEAARVLNALTDDQRTSLGITSWDPVETYARVDRLFVTLCEILESGRAKVDATWFANRLARAAIPKDLLTSKSVAVDGTDVETWGALRGASHTVELDGEAAETQLMDGATGSESPKTKVKVKTAKVFGIGDDGRKRYTADPDARAGHRSAVGNRNAGPYVGYELHLAVQTRDVRWTNHIDKTAPRCRE